MVLCPGIVKLYIVGDWLLLFTLLRIVNFSAELLGLSFIQATHQILNSVMVIIRNFDVSFLAFFEPIHFMNWRDALLFCLCFRSRYLNGKVALCFVFCQVFLSELLILIDCILKSVKTDSDTNRTSRPSACLVNFSVSSFKSILDNLAHLVFFAAWFE